MGTHTNSMGGPPIDDSALRKHFNRDGSKFTVDQISKAWLRPIYEFPPDPDGDYSFRLFACWGDSDEPFEVGVANYGNRRKEKIIHFMPLVDRTRAGSLVDKLDQQKPGWDDGRSGWRDKNWRPGGGIMS